LPGGGGELGLRLLNASWSSIAVRKKNGSLHFIGLKEIILGSERNQNMTKIL
jgi:hypothetical protein